MSDPGICTGQDSSSAKAGEHGHQLEQPPRPRRPRARPEPDAAEAELGRWKGQKPPPRDRWTRQRCAAIRARSKYQTHKSEMPAVYDCVLGTRLLELAHVRPHVPLPARAPAPAQARATPDAAGDGVGAARHAPACARWGDRRAPRDEDQGPHHLARDDGRAARPEEAADRQDHASARRVGTPRVVAVVLRRRQARVAAELALHGDRARDLVLRHSTAPAHGSSRPPIRASTGVPARKDPSPLGRIWKNEGAGRAELATGASCQEPIARPAPDGSIEPTETHRTRPVALRAETEAARTRPPSAIRRAEERIAAAATAAAEPLQVAIAAKERRIGKLGSSLRRARPARRRGPSGRDRRGCLRGRGCAGVQGTVAGGRYHARRAPAPARTRARRVLEVMRRGRPVKPAHKPSDDEEVASQIERTWKTFGRDPAGVDALTIAKIRRGDS